MFGAFRGSVWDRSEGREAGKEQCRDKAGQEEGGRVMAWGKKGGFLEEALL